MSYVASRYWTPRGYAEGDPQVPAGASGKRKWRKKRVVEIDGEEFSVDSVEEAQALLDLARKEAQAKAEEAQEKANAAVLRPTRKVLRDAERSLAVPVIDVPPEVKQYADKVLEDIRGLYESTLKSIEISALLRRIERDQQEEEEIEEILLLMA